MSTPTTEALTRHVADWLQQHPMPERWELANALGEHAGEFGRTDLGCEPDSPEVAAVEAAVTAVVADLVRHATWAPSGQDGRDEKLLARLTVSGDRLREADVWFPELVDWYRGHMEHRRDRPAKRDDPARLAAMAAGLSTGDPGE